MNEWMNNDMTGHVGGRSAHAGLKLKTYALYRKLKWVELKIDRRKTLKL